MAGEIDRRFRGIGLWSKDSLRLASAGTGLGNESISIPRRTAGRIELTSLLLRSFYLAARQRCSRLEMRLRICSSANASLEVGQMMLELGPYLKRQSKWQSDRLTWLN